MIIEEIRMYLDNPLSVAYEAAKTAHFGGTRWAIASSGPSSRSRRLTVDQMRDYFATRYSPANIVLAFAGKADWDPLVKLAQTHCGAWEGWPASRQATTPRGTGAFQTILRADDLQQTIVGVSDGPPLESADRYAAYLLATILGDHTGSRLYCTLIDPGLADGAEVSYQNYEQAGAFFTFLSCEPDSTQANLGRIEDGLRDPDARRPHRERAEPGQEQGARPLGPPQRASHGPAGLTRVPLDFAESISRSNGSSRPSAA